MQSRFLSTCLLLSFQIEMKKKQESFLVKNQENSQNFIKRNFQFSSFKNLSSLISSKIIVMFNSQFSIFSFKKGWFTQKNFWNSCDAEHFQKSSSTYFSFLKKVLKLHRLSNIFLNFSTKKKVKIYFWIFSRKRKKFSFASH